MKERRRLQIESTLLRAIQEVLARGLNDPRVRGLVTITRVSLNEDLGTLTAYVSVLPEERTDLTMHGLRSAAPAVRRDVMGKVHLREMPKLIFERDGQHQAQRDVLAAIARVADEREANTPSPGVEPEADTGEPAAADHVDHADHQTDPHADPQHKDAQP